MIKWTKDLTKWIKNLFTKKTKIWAYKSESCSPWTKVVSYEKPGYYSHCYSKVIGPFRSEVDCEEFCDHNNIVGYQSKKYIEV